MTIVAGAGAIAFAVISRKGSSFSTSAIIGLILGIFSVLAGIGVFLSLSLLTEFLRDPENAAVFEEMMQEIEREMMLQ